MKFLSFGLYKVRGQSMEPGLRAGSVVVGWRWFKPRVGDVVVIRHDRPLIKRVIDVKKDKIWVEGDNKSASTDSRHFGYVGPQDLEAKVIKQL